ncbi:hypothetical protein ACFFH1_10340, partial [Pseudofulvimonas gallinarii]
MPAVLNCKFNDVREGFARSCRNRATGWPGRETRTGSALIAGKEEEPLHVGLVSAVQQRHALQGVRQELHGLADAPWIVGRENQDAGDARPQGRGGRVSVGRVLDQRKVRGQQRRIAATCRMTPATKTRTTASTWRCAPWKRRCARSSPTPA